jgi:hypothetical protein
MAVASPIRTRRYISYAGSVLVYGLHPTQLSFDLANAPVDRYRQAPGMPLD